MRRALVLVGVDAVYAATVELAVPVPIPVRVASPREFVRMLADGEVWAALIDDDVFTAEFRQAVATLQQRGVGAPMLCHSGRPLRDVRGELAELGIGCVHRGEDARSMWAGIRRSVVRRLREAAGRRIGVSEHSHLLIWQAIRALLVARQPFHSVAALARHLGCDSSSLYKAWKTLFGRAEGLTLGEFVDGVLLLHAVEHISPSKGLRRTLSAFHVRPDRVHRAASVFGGTFDEFQGRRLLDLVHAFEERALERLWTSRDMTPRALSPLARQSASFHELRQGSQV